MLIFVVIIFAALAIDFSQRAVSVQEAQSFAKFAALAALQGYSSKPSTDPETVKLDAALVAANNSGGKNAFMSATNGHSAEGFGGVSGLPAPAPGPLDPPTPSPAIVVGPKLTAGRYFFSNPTDCPNACTSGSVPCFVEMKDIASTSYPATCKGVNADVPNAFRVSGKYYAKGKTILAQVFSSGDYSVDVDEIAMFAPRRGVMLVDISNSMFRETHSLGDPLAFYAYGLKNSATGPAFASGDILNTEQSTSYGGLPDTRPTGIANPLEHYKNDYSMVIPLSDGAFNPEFEKHHPKPTDGSANPTMVGTTSNHSASNVGDNFLLDSYRSASYAGPEPFNTVLRGLDSAVTEFQKRAVTGDKLGIVFFDTVVSWPRVLKLTSDFDYIRQFTQNTPSAMSLRHLHQIFPRIASFSNLKLGIAEALTLFSADNTVGMEVPSVDFMTYFGDGLANCADVNFLDSTGTAPAPFQSKGCYDEYFGYNAAYNLPTNGLKDFVQEKLVPRKIPFHAVMVGGHVGPHTLAWKGPDGCLTDAQARSQSVPVPFVDGSMTLASGVPALTHSQKKTVFNNASDAHPFYQVNEDLYLLTRYTGGVWGPVRKDGGCAGVDPPEPQPACDTVYSDSAVRKRYDTTCKNENDVVVGYIKQIMGSNPFMIVPKE